MSGADDERAIERLYAELLSAWNRGSADDFAALFARDGNTVGFDGSQLDGRDAIRSSLAAIFADHTPAAYVGTVREVRSLAPGAALLRAVAGMVPPGEQDLNENLSIQSLVAVREGDEWRIALWHNTPAAFDGRPDDRAALADELRALLPAAGRRTPAGPRVRPSDA